MSSGGPKPQHSHRGDDSPGSSDRLFGPLGAVAHQQWEGEHQGTAGEVGGRARAGPGRRGSLRGASPGRATGLYALATLAAAIVVARVGTATVSAAELIDGVSAMIV